MQLTSSELANAEDRDYEIFKESKSSKAVAVTIEYELDARHRYAELTDERVVINTEGSSLFLETGCLEIGYLVHFKMVS